MYADRRSYVSGRSSGLDPRSLGIAVAVNAAAVGALLLVSPVLTIVRHDRPLTTYAVPVTPPPDPLPPPKTPDHPQAQHQTISVPTPPLQTTTALPPLDTSTTLPPIAPTTADPGPVATAEPTPVPALVTIAPEVDPAHRGDLQPGYPGDELRAEREGVVQVRVLVGVDGRVRQVEQVGATSDSFFRSTRDQALRRWRFRPATRGGVPVEAWRTMTIRFVIPR